jgi:hypothetical protein
VLPTEEESSLIIDLFNLLGGTEIRCILDRIILEYSLDTTRLSGSNSSIHALISTAKPGGLTFSNRILGSLLV